MKKLTYSSMATARLRANKRQYLSLVLGIFLSIFMISSLVFSVYGIYLAELDDRHEKVGYLDFVILDNDVLTDEQVAGTGDYDRMGHAYISGVVTDRNVYVGHYDDIGKELLDLNPIEGRLPAHPGEIAIELSAMDVLEVGWSLGETVELSITPIDGVAETRAFTLVGILPERSVHLAVTDLDGIGQFPAIVISEHENAFATGRIGIHNLMGFGKTGSIAESSVNFWTKYPEVGLTAVYGLNLSGDQEWGVSGAQMDQETQMLVLMACVLAGSLILSCGVGISGAMEGVLMKRREEIGVLRALGATRRQIRRMFGRENLLIALIVSPLSIALSALMVWVLAQLLPDTLQFGFNLWLILPVALFSVIVILLSGYLPLVRASKLMPMSVIRDTSMLRRSKGVKSKKEFSPSKLMASRQVRFNPTRQFGAALLVALMLLCSGLLSCLIVNASDYLGMGASNVGFMLRTGYGYSSQYIQTYDYDCMDKQGLNQIRSLDHVESLNVERRLPVLLQLEKAPMYAMMSVGAFDNYGMLSDDDYERTRELNVDTRVEEYRDEMRAEYLAFQKTYGFESEVFCSLLITVDLTDKNVALLKGDLEDGKIDVDAINAGQQVLIYAPEIWGKTYENGASTYYSGTDAVEKAKAEGGYELLIWNDAFTAGMTLPVTQLFRTEQDGEVFRKDATVQVGGVLKDLDDSFGLGSAAYIITTEQGLEKMGLQPEGLNAVQVNLDGEITLEEEETLERQLTAISRRYSGYTVHNQMESYREGQRDYQQEILLVFAVVTVFFAVSVSMIVSSVIRQLHSEGRTIGMLRAVGADEKTVLGCYSGTLNASVFGGFGICLVLFIVFLVLLCIDAMPHGYNPLAGQMDIISIFLISSLAMAAACWLLARQILRLRIREIVNKSIIDNIREL